MAAEEGTSLSANDASADKATSSAMVRLTELISSTTIEISHCSRQQFNEEELIVLQ